MKTIIHNDWQEVLQAEFASESYRKLHNFLKEEYRTQKIHPDMYHIFTAFELTPFQDVKVVILGQDPYHGPNQAHGLSFSVLPGQAIPPSLQNIYKELASDLGVMPVNHGYLVDWAKQGVLMLNTVLTVREGQAFSHQGRGWEKLTDAAISALSNRKQPVIFVLWGKAAQDKIKLIDTKRNIIIKSAHPSPLSAYRGFFGSKPFSKVNAALEAMGQAPINWQLPAHVK
ncbi:uracil-DNA glycosylase [Ligilactobacillus equi]|uniref:Uracil-DNA glycosylase n=2 Tax=Ligilactobacillus equi TaxID=137357 RepID=V7HXZ3_9LACO|nr:uracil-DNA glycosylase [Ligilactobacillus equi]ETA74757.1 uracil-DNA glycosylase [Ligilactobacillus equi DPC 6820]KRL85009.1 uracil-DNA glycosylase [Ligilactobacillus equi DSM 15833 = JCM 10991]MCQ2556622.1 uracil-DNA glycosylase [Ligilactobacillus sp.]